MTEEVLLGTAFITDKGDWAAGTAYEENDIVHTTDGVYMSLVDDNITTPSADNEQWRLWVDLDAVNTATSNATAATKEAEEAEAARAKAETARANAESTRQSNETARQKSEESRTAAESSRAAAETSRADAETARAKAETSRADAETERQGSETERKTSETERKESETARKEAEASRATAEEKRQADTATAISNSETQTEIAKGYNEHPPKVGDNGNWQTWDGSAYTDTGIPSRGDTLYPTFTHEGNKLYITDTGGTVSQYVKKEGNKLTFEIYN